MMKDEVILYKRKNSIIRFIGLLLLGICFFTTIIFIMDSLNNHQKIDVNIIIFTIILIVLGIYINTFTGYTEEILISYNKKGFKVKNDEFIEWKQLKRWSLNIKEKEDNNPVIYKKNNDLRKILPFPLNLFISIFPKVRKYTLKLELTDKKIIAFLDEEVKDMFKFIIFLRKNLKNKQNGKIKF